MNWAQVEMETVDLGDGRLNGRAAKVLEQLGAHPQWSIPTACGGWAETMGAYRFFDNERATFESVLAPHRDATLRRLAACPVALLVQDTTECDEWVNLGPKGLGTIKEREKHPRRLHPTVAFTPERICLGTVEARWWERDQPSPREERRYKGVDEKESGRWIESYEVSCAIQGQAPNTLIVNLADAEGDIYEWFADYDEFAPPTRAEWIVRAAQDRRLVAKPGRKLWETLVPAPCLGRVEVEVKPRPNRPARIALVAIRAASVVLQPPARNGYRLPKVTINAVLVREEHPPAGLEALEWLLLTSLRVDTFERAAQVVAWYGVRWSVVS